MPRGVYQRQPRGAYGTRAEREKRRDRVAAGLPAVEPPSRMILDPGPDGGERTVHWSPEDALGWSCVRCHRTFVRPSPEARWAET